MTKEALRGVIQERLRGLNAHERTARSEKIWERLQSAESYKQSRTICFFAGLPREVDTFPMMAKALKSGKRLVLPRVRPGQEERRLDCYRVESLESDLIKGALGILEPIPDPSRRVDAGDLDCVLVPGIAFDADGRRLGRGKGYYDRFLAEEAQSAAKIGLAFSFQLVEQVPVEAHDQRVDCVITD